MASVTTPEDWYLGERLMIECDFLMPDGNACDEPGRYAIWWKAVPERDRGSRPVSSGCLDHALTVDRNHVEHMHSMPAVTS